MRLPEQVKKKLQTLPDKPGVYFMRDRHGKIIYVGKAVSLRSRVRSYFRQGTLRSAEPKLRGLIRSIADFEFLVLRNDAEATLTEGRLIKEYRPRYNVLFRDDKRFLLLRVDPSEPFPRFTTCRIKKDDQAVYFGPYANSAAVYAAKEFVEKRFGLRVCRPRVPGPQDHKHCLNDIIRYCSAPCIAKVSPEAYRERVNEALAFMRGDRPELLKDIREAMAKAAAAQHYEKAAALRDTLLLLQEAIKRRIRGEKTLAIRAEDARAGIEQLQRALGLASAPRVIETYDISNISGTFAVGSMVCAVDGIPQRNRYRLFRIKTVEGSDDPRMMAEVIERRYARVVEEKGALPDLVIVDGGITQLRAARGALDGLGLRELPAVGLAKRFEEIYPMAMAYEARRDAPGKALRQPIRLPEDSPALKVCKHIRDEAHRFALTYHRRLRMKRLRESILDDVPGIGEKRKELMLGHFGSIARLRRASVEDLQTIPGVGPAMAGLIKETVGEYATRHRQPVS
jgi:excinuclease ABC subunit C